MKQILMDCQTCQDRRLLDIDAERSRALSLNYECEYYCQHCGKPTMWSFSSHDRRDGRDRRDYPRPVVEEMPTAALGKQKVVMARPVSRNEYASLAHEDQNIVVKKKDLDRRTAPQRSSKRLPLTLPVRVRVLDPQRGFFEITETRDVSRGGILFHSSKFYYIGDPVMIALNYSAGVAGSDLEQGGKVVRVVPLETGSRNGVAVQLGKAR